MQTIKVLSFPALRDKSFIIDHFIRGVGICCHLLLHWKDFSELWVHFLLLFVGELQVMLKMVLDLLEVGVGGLERGEATMWRAVHLCFLWTIWKEE